MNSFLQRASSLFAAALITSAAFSQTIVTETNMNGWEKKQNQTGKSGFTKGPATPPLGSSSANISLGSTGAGYATMSSGELYKKKPLSQLTALKYCTFIQESSTGSKAPYLMLSVVSKERGVDKFDDLYFEPAYQPGLTVTKGAWQTWDALNGYWWSKNSAGGATKQSPKKLSAILAAVPGLTLANSHVIQISAGAPVVLPENSWNGFNGNFDNVRIGVEGTTTIYNFETLACDIISMPCPGNLTANTEPGYCSANVSVPTPSATGGCGNVTVNGTRSDGAAITAPYPAGTTTITWVATDGDSDPVTCTQTVTVTDTEAPRLSWPTNVAQGDTKQRGTDEAVCSYTVKGTEFDITAWDACGATRSYTLTGATEAVKSPATSLAGVVLNKGVTTISWTATDAAGNSSSGSFDVNVYDDEAPVISPITATPNVLWSPNHKMHDVLLNYTVTDNCNEVNYGIYMVDSNEPVNGLGDGNTEADIKILSDFHVQLRAERSGTRDGRVYGIINIQRPIVVNEAGN